MHIIGEAPTCQILAHMGLDTVFHNIIISPAAFVVANTDFILSLCECVRNILIFPHMS